MVWGRFCLTSSRAPSVSGLPSLFHVISFSSSIRVAIWEQDRRIVALTGSLWLANLGGVFYGRRFLVSHFHSESLIP